MKKHPDKNQLIGYILNFPEKQAPVIGNHLKECAECNKLAASMESILRKSENTAIRPSDKVLENITTLLNDRQNSKKISEPGTIRRFILHPVPIAIIVFFALAILFPYNYYKTSPTLEKINLLVSNKNGNILYENNLLQKNEVPVNSGSLISRKNSSAILSLDSFFTLSIAENTELFVNSTVRKDNIYELDFELKTGDIFAEWKDYNLQKTFLIKTKYAYYKAIGTGFILSATKELSRLAVIEGKVLAISPESGNEILVNSGEGCISGKSIKKIQIDSEFEQKNFKKLFNKNEHTSSEKKEKPAIKESAKMEKNINSNQNEDKQNNPEKDKTMNEIRNEKMEMQKENRKIQREMRNKLRINKNSKR